VNSNAAKLIERCDFKNTGKTDVQVNTSLSRSWLQTPNTFDQQAPGKTSTRRWRASMWLPSPSFLPLQSF